MQQRQLEDVEHRPVGEADIVDGERFAVAQHGGAAGLDVDRMFDLREIGLKPLAGDIGGHLQVGMLAGLGVVIIGLELVDVLRIGQPPVVAGLVADVEEQHQAGGKADRQAKDVDEGIGLVLDQRPDAHRHIIAPHDPCSFVSLVRQAARRCSTRMRPSSMFTTRPA
jgi:hypothetical protein